VRIVGSAKCGLLEVQRADIRADRRAGEGWEGLESAEKCRVKQFDW
jgi:hypothetical protein